MRRDAALILSRVPDNARIANFSRDAEFAPAMGYVKWNDAAPPRRDRTVSDLSNTARTYIDASDSVILGPVTLHLVREEHRPPERQLREFGNSEYLPLRSAALVGMPGDRVLRGHTIGVSVDGLSMMLSTPLQLGEECRVLFTLSIRDHLTAISGVGTVTACERKMADHYRVDMRFAIDNPRAKGIVEQLLSDRTQIH